MLIVCMWTAWCTILKNTKQNLKILKKHIFYDFLKYRIFRKLITDFENRTKRQAETKECVVLDADHWEIADRASSVHFATGHFHPFRTLPVWVQKFEIWIIIISVNVSDLTNLCNLWLKRVRNLGNQTRNEVYREEQTLLL